MNVNKKIKYMSQYPNNAYLRLTSHDTKSQKPCTRQLTLIYVTLNLLQLQNVYIWLISEKQSHSKVVSFAQHFYFSQCKIDLY